MKTFVGAGSRQGGVVWNPLKQIQWDARLNWKFGAWKLELCTELWHVGADVERWLMTEMGHLMFPRTCHPAVQEWCCPVGFCCLCTGSWVMGVWRNPQESRTAGIPCKAVDSKTKEMWKLKKKIN